MRVGRGGCGGCRVGEVVTGRDRGLTPQLSGMGPWWPCNPIGVPGILWDARAPAGSYLSGACAPTRGGSVPGGAMTVPVREGGMPPSRSAWSRGGLWRGELVPEPAVLVVEDDAELLEAWASLFLMSGFAAAKASDGIRAFQHLVSFPVDLLVTDVFLPDMDGLELIQSVRRFAPTLPIIAVAGNVLGDPDRYLRIARAMGADASIGKPVPAGQLIEVARRLLST